MSDRVSQTIVICEDEAHQRLTKAFLKRCKLPADPPMVKWHAASWETQGGNDGWVLNRFPKELHACRQRNKKTKTLLVVLIGADQCTIAERRRQLGERAVAAGLERLAESDPVAILIPKRHIETWLRSLLGESVSEDEECKSWKPAQKVSYRQAADTLHDWLRPNGTIGITCVASLRTALPVWKKIC